MTLTGSRTCGAWPEPSSTTSSPPVCSASAAPRRDGRDRIALAVDHEHGAANTSARAPVTLPGSSLRPPSSRSWSRRRSRAPSRRRPRSASSSAAPVNMFDDEELDEVAVVAQPVVAVVLRPALVGVVARRRSRRGSARAAVASAARKVGPMKTAPSTRSGCSAASSRPRCAPREKPDDHGALRLGRVHHGERVGGELALVVRRRLPRPVGAAVAAPVERDHAAVAREVGDLHLPVPRVDERPGRQEQDRRLARRRRPRRRPGRRRARRSRTRPGSAPGSARRAGAVSSTAIGRSTRGALRARSRCRRGARR